MKLWPSNQYHNALQTNQQLPQSPQDLGVRLDQVPSFAKGLKAHGELPFWMCPVRWGYPTGAELVRHMWWVWSSYYLYVARARNHWCPGLYKVDFWWSSGAALPCSSLSERGIGIIGSALFSISKSSLHVVCRPIIKGFAAHEVFGTLSFVPSTWIYPKGLLVDNLFHTKSRCGTWRTAIASWLQMNAKQKW